MASELQSDTFQSMQDQMRDQVARIINALYGGSLPGQQQQGSSNITPSADVIEDDNGYRLIFDVPGVDPRQLEVNVTGNTLSVRAQRDTEASQAQREQQNQQSQQGQQGQQTQQRRQHILLTERRTGTFRREFRLPEDADRNRINADFRNGVLTLTVNRSQEANQRRRVEIKSA
jgi:HSP20 family protein